MNEHIAEVHAEIDAMGKGKVSVDGVDVSGSLDGLEIVAGFGQPSKVLLHERAGVDLTVDAALTVVKAQHGVLQFLDEIDADDLEQRTLAKEHLPVGQGFIEALKDIAREMGSA